MLHLECLRGIGGVRTREVDVKRLFRTGTEVVEKSDTVSSERDPRSTDKIRTNDFLQWYN